MKLEALVIAFETLTPQTLPALAALYAEDARFRDPFNQVRGRAAITAIFRHMFTQVEAPRFVVTEQVAEGAQAFLVWEFHFLRGGHSLCIHGGSHLKFNADGLVSEHRDYWDAAEELYARLPLIGPLMRWLQRQLSAGKG
mgnify:CR=1 FL=1